MKSLFSILLSVSKDNIFHSLDIFWKGMVAIIIVLAIVFAVTKLMTFTANRLHAKNEAKKNLKNKDTDN